MKTLPCPRCTIAATLLFFTLAGCASKDQSTMRGSSNSSATGAGMGMMDAEMASMCHEMREKMAAAKTPQERAAIMQERMKSMTPEMRQSMQQNMGANRCE